LEDVFAITESKSDRSAREESLLEICRSRWELQNRTAELEAELRGMEGITRDLRDKISKADFQQRELLKNLAKIVDECDDILQVEGLRLTGADPDDPAARLTRKWYRKVERTRQNLMDRLNSYGVTTRNPVGKPSPDLDTIHNAVETDSIPAGEIVKVLRCGLLWNGTILRCSLVSIAQPCEMFSEETQPPLRPQEA
jgi:molecular chaperone GrpE (heat shock protein)